MSIAEIKVGTTAVGQDGQIYEVIMVNAKNNWYSEGKIYLIHNKQDEFAYPFWVTEQGAPCTPASTLVNKHARVVWQLPIDDTEQPDLKVLAGHVYETVGGRKALVLDNIGGSAEWPFVAYTVRNGGDSYPYLIDTTGGTINLSDSLIKRISRDAFKLTQHVCDNFKAPFVEPTFKLTNVEPPENDGSLSLDEFSKKVNDWNSKPNLFLADLPDYDAPVVPQHLPLKSGCEPVEGYERLEAVLKLAYDQAALGKGADRHGGLNVPFHEQPMQQINRMLTSTHGFVFQAHKKSLEATRLPNARAIAELLGAINYLAGAVIYIQDQEV